MSIFAFYSLIIDWRELAVKLSLGEGKEMVSERVISVMRLAQLRQANFTFNLSYLRSSRKSGTSGTSAALPRDCTRCSMTIYLPLLIFVGSVRNSENQSD